MGPHGLSDDFLFLLDAGDRERDFDTLDDVPCITAQGLKKYLPVIHYDGML